jgi:hypothetical protein
MDWTGLGCLSVTTRPWTETPSLVLGFLGVLSDREKVLRSRPVGRCIPVGFIGISYLMLSGTSLPGPRYPVCLHSADGRCCESEQYRVRCPPQPSLPYMANNASRNALRDARVFCLRLVNFAQVTIRACNLTSLVPSVLRNHAYAMVKSLCHH